MRTGCPNATRLTHEYETFRTRDISAFAMAYLCIDTVYKPLRRWGSQAGVLCVWGTCVDGRKGLRTLSTAQSESDESCLEVLRDLVKRGLQPPGTITTYGVPGLHQSHRGEVAALVADPLLVSYDAASPPESTSAGLARVQSVSGRHAGCPTFEEGQRRQQALLAQYQETFPEACRCLADDAEASLNHLKVPARHRQYVRTSNLAERAFEEDRRRTKVIPHLWDEGSVVKLVFAVLIRVSERWGKKQFSEFEQRQIRILRQTLALYDFTMDTVH